MDQSTAAAITRAIGVRVRTARRRAGVTQAELAAKLDLTHQQIQKYERAHNRIPATTLVEIAAALAISPASLIEDSARTHRPDPLEGLITFESVRLLHAFAQLAPDQRATLLAKTEALASDRTSLASP